MEKKKLKFFNLFDIIVLLIALILLAVLFFMGKGAAPADGAGVGTSQKVTYTLELTGMQNGAAELIKPGDRLTDKIKKYDIGTVVSVETKITTMQVEDYENGGVIDSPVSTQQTAVVVVEADCTETDSQITVGNGYIVRVGATANIRGPGYAGTGYVIEMERGED